MSSNTERYTEEKIKKALSKWKYASAFVPRVNSIRSKIIDNASDTYFVLYKRYPIWEYVGIPNHYYISIGDMTWHPGFNESNEIFTVEDTNNYQTVMCKEMCPYCMYHQLDEMFRLDAKFNPVTNNCQRITGFVAETTLLISALSNMIVFVLTGRLVCLVASLLLMFVIIVYIIITRNTRMEFTTCEHVQKII